VNLYDVFRRLVEARPFQDFERAEALKLLTEAEQMNVFGSVAAGLVESHEHQWADLYRGNLRGVPGRQRCTVPGCMVEREVP